MFQGFSQRRRLAGQSRRARANRQQNRSRRLSLETLEPRQMLSHSPIEFHPPGLPSDGDDHVQLPAGLTVTQQTHWINGVPFQFIADPLSADEAGTEETSTQATGSLQPLTSIPQLHSDPSAPATLYLDFDGHFEAQWGSYSNITTPVFDRDVDPTTFSDAELETIYDVWSRVVEDFVPFNVNVTTVEPPELAPGVPETAANGVAMRISIGGDSSWLGAVNKGVSYINSFTNSVANVAYVFSDNSPWPGDTASHEAGHAFGPHHQSVYDQNGVKTEEYLTGSGNWRPIMGTSLKDVTTWHNGTSAYGPTEFQDDMAIIAGSVNGFGYRADDHANSLGAATPLAIDGTTWSGSGIIGKNDDVDVFSFTVAAESIYRMASHVAAIGPNLDAVLELRNAAGQLLAMANPFDSQSAEIVRSLVPGSYFLSALSSGVYGWIGQYTVTIDTPEAAVFVTPTSYPLTTSETAAASSFTVVLSTAPTADVQIPVSTSNAAEGTASTTSLVFTPTNWNVPQTVTVTGLNDDLTDGDMLYSIVLASAVSADPAFSGLNPADVLLTNLDNDVKFYVVNDATTDTTYKYAADAKTRGTSALAAGNTAPRGIASTIAGDKTWVIDANRNVYVYSVAGALLGSWTAGTMNTSATPEGIATNGTDVWIVDAKSDKVYRYAGAASRLSGSQNAASSFSLYSNKFNQSASNTNPKDIVTDGQSLWVVNDAATDKVFKYSISGSLLGSWTIDPANQTPTGITINPANLGNIWIVDSGTDRVYQYSNAAFRTSASQTAALTFALAAGNTNPQGIADPPAPGTIEPASLQASATSQARALDQAMGQWLGDSARSPSRGVRPLNPAKLARPAVPTALQHQLTVRTTSQSSSRGDGGPATTDPPSSQARPWTRLTDEVLSAWNTGDCFDSVLPFEALGV